MDTLKKTFDEISYESPEYLAVRNIGFRVFMTPTYYNSGSTPLRIDCEIVSSLTQEEWEENYSKEPERFAKDLRSFTELESWETDVIIMPDSSYKPKKAKGTGRRMRKELFEEYINRDTSIIIYPYMYTEYEDFFGRRYNTLLIWHMILEFESVRKYWIAKDSLRFGVEKYRWDIGLKSD